MRRSQILLLLSVFLSVFHSPLFAFRRPKYRLQPAPIVHPFLFDFMGKAERVSWDIGVVKATFAVSPALQSGNVIFGGNSSGALLAGYFGCWGVSKASIEMAEEIINHFDYELLNLDTKGKMRRLFGNRVFGFSVKLEEDHIEIGKLIDQLLSKGGRSCVPARGILISATNLDVLDSRVYDPGKQPRVEIWARDQSQANRPDLIPPTALTRSSKRDKTVDWDNFNVSRSGIHLGKACTYFVTQDLFDKLRALDRNKRQCELRLIQTIEDLRLALHASVAEPTFFEPVVETEPNKILGGIVQLGTRRVYNGGYLVSPLGRDLKRLDPCTFAFGTGVKPFPDRADVMLQAWFTMSPNQSLLLQKAALDAEVPVPWDWDTEIPLPADLEMAGFEGAKPLIEDLQRSCRLP